MGKFYFENFLVGILNYVGRTVLKLSLQDRFLFRITTYQHFRNNKVNLYEFFFLGTQVQTKIQNITEF